MTDGIRNSEFERNERVKFAELHCASAFSFLEGASQPEDLVERAVELGLGTVALIDRNTVSGAPRFWKAAKEAGIKPLVGAEVVLDETDTGYWLLDTGRWRQEATRGQNLVSP